MNARRSRIALRGFRPHADGLARVLGDLETAVMELLWEQPGQTVVEVEQALRRRRRIAHTTVLTTLDRLHRKGYLVRDKAGKAFVYTPRETRDQFERGLAQEVLSGLLSQSRGLALSTFVDLVGTDQGALDRLEALIRERRREVEPS
jgi:predicted transcriptional regulator